MDLKTYIESEIEEEKELGHSTSGVTGSDANGYPGPESVHVAESDVSVENISFEADGVSRSAYVAKPRDGGGGNAPAVLVIHENKGLVPYIKNTARRLAQHGYVAVAPDLLARVGGSGKYPQDADAIDAIKELDPQGMVDDVRAILSEVARRDDVDGDRLGIIGFCFGGGVAWRVMTQEPQLTAGVPFYGPTPDADAVDGIKASVLGIYGEKDERITSMLPGIQDAMEKHGKDFEPVVFPDAGHAFHNDTNPDRYNPDAAEQAWERATGFLDAKLKA